MKYVRGSITQKQLRSVLRYDPKTGNWWWRVNRGPVRAGDRAGSLHPNRYRGIRVDGVYYGEARLAWFYMKGVWPPVWIDHEDRRPGNGRWRNLRKSSISENARNRKVRSDSRLGVKGVTFHRGYYVARIAVKKNKRVVLGWFKKLRQAKIAYQGAAIKYHGKFARLS